MAISLNIDSISSFINNIPAPQTGGPKPGNGAVIGAGLGSVLPGVGTAIGSVVGAIVDLISSLGIKGTTQHLTYQQASPECAKAADSMNAIFSGQFSESEKGKLLRFIADRFHAAMSVYWGLNVRGNNWIYGEVTKWGSNASGNSNEAFWQLLYLFFVWVATNVDAQNEQEPSNVIAAEFPEIFIKAVSDAGLVFKEIPGSSIPDSSPTGSTSVSKASLFSPVILYVIIGGAILFLFFKR